MSEDYTVCRCGAKFTNDAEGKRLYDLHQSWCGKQGTGQTRSSTRVRGRRGQRDQDEQTSESE